VKINEVSVYFIIAILGLAYPVSLQVVSRLDEKYRSKNIIALFKSEDYWKLFHLSLYASLLGLLAQLLIKLFWKKETLFEKGLYDFNEFLFIAFSAALVGSFLLYIRKIFIYYTPNELIHYLVRKNDHKDFIYFQAMADILITAIQLQDEALAKTVLNYNYQKFKDWRENHKGDPIIYPNIYYNIVYTTIIEAGTSSSRKMQFVGLDAASGRWFFSQFDYSAISPMTYSWTWHNLKLITEIKNDDYIFEFWKNSHQYSSTGLAPISAKINRDDASILNKDEVDLRERERDKFFEFHFALGGMMLYAERYQLLKRIFSHTMSIPPRYELLPITMTTIFNVFIRFFDDNHMMFPYPYHFPGLDGIYGEGQSKNWICRYLALLLVRQYTLTSYYYGYNPIAMPQLPTSQGDIQTWINNLPVLKAFVKEVQDNRTLMKVTGYETVTDQSCANSGIQTPIQLVERVIELSKQAFQVQAVEQTIAPEKLEAFYTRSSQIIAGRIASYSDINSSIAIDQEFDSLYISGSTVLFNKAAFSNGQGVSYIDYDSFLGSKQAKKITDKLTSMFYSKITASYLLDRDKIFKSIDKLNLNPEEHVILNFGIAIDFINYNLKHSELSSDSYKGISILNVDYANRSLIRSSFLVVKKGDLPKFIYEEIPAATIQENKLNLINPEYQIFGSVIDLNEAPEFRPAFADHPDSVLDRSVILKLTMLMEVRWKKQFKMVEIKLYSSFYQDGIQNDLAEIGSF
jgi:hypothetical protein